MGATDFFFDSSKGRMSEFKFFLRGGRGFRFCWQTKTARGLIYIFLEEEGRIYIFFHSSKQNMSGIIFFWRGGGGRIIFFFFGRAKEHVDGFTFFLMVRDGLHFFFLFNSSKRHLNGLNVSRGGTDLRFFVRFYPFLDG